MKPEAAAFFVAQDLRIRIEALSIVCNCQHCKLRLDFEPYGNTGCMGMTEHIRQRFLGDAIKSRFDV